MIADREQLIGAIAKEVMARLEERLSGGTPGDDGVFPSVDQAVQAAAAAQQRVAAMSLEDRGRMVTIIRRLCNDNAEEWARLELDETRIGRADHKAAKLRNIRLVPGVEAMRTEALSDTSGLCVIEHAPWGVI